LSPLDPQSEAAKHFASTGIGEIDILERNAAAAMDQLPRALPIDHFVAFADHLNRVGNPRDELTRIDRRKCEIERALEDAKGDRHGQNHITGGDPSLAP